VRSGDGFPTDDAEVEWELRRRAYAASAVDSEDEAVAAAAIVAFAEDTNHAQAACYVGHWHFHGEAGLPPSPALALLWYERAALRGDANGAESRDKLYLSGSGCGPGSAAHGRAVVRLREFISLDRNPRSAAEGAAAAAAWAASARLNDWGLSASPTAGDNEPENSSSSSSSSNSSSNSSASASPVEAVVTAAEGGAFGSGGGFGSPPRRWASSPDISGGGSNFGLKTAEAVSEAVGPPNVPRGLEAAAVESGLALGVLPAAQSYGEFMVALESEKASRVARAAGAGHRGWRLKPKVLIPDDALTYR
jgi:hypothetical protein